MNGKDLKALREGAAMTQTEAARALGITYSSYCDYERGYKPVPESMEAEIQAKMARRQKSQIVTASPNATEFALGEAVLMLTPEQRDELYERCGRALVAEAASRVAMNRIRKTLAEALEEERRDHRRTKAELESIRRIATQGSRP